MRFYFPWEPPETVRRASGSGRSASRGIGTGSRSVSWLRNASPGVYSRVHGVDPPIWYTPPPLDVADDGLSAFMDMNVFDRDPLLAFAAMAVEGFEQRRIGARQFVGLREILAPPLEGLIADHGPAVAFHRGAVASDKLSSKHSLKLILRLDTGHGINRRTLLPLQFAGSLNFSAMTY